jgi:O-acetyl-ADP-ribose deacetylase (regulator of RNase III)
MIKYVKGDLFKSGARIIAHGVNCQGAFGSGVAGQIVKKHPLAASAYFAKFDLDGWKLGDVQFASPYDTDTHTDGPLYIANCATQKEYYPRDKVHADYARHKDVHGER